MIKYALRGSVICRLRSLYCCYSHSDEVKALILWNPNSRRGMSTNGATCVNAIHSLRVCQLQTTSLNLLTFYEKILWKNANLSEQISWFIYNCRIAKILKYTRKIINKCMIELLCYLIYVSVYDLYSKMVNELHLEFHEKFNVRNIFDCKQC